MAVIHGNGRATILLHVPPTFSLTHFSLLRSLTSSVRPSLRMSSHLLPSLPSSFLSPLPRSSFPRPLPWPPSPPPPPPSPILPFLPFLHRVSPFPFPPSPWLPSSPSPSPSFPHFFTLLALLSIFRFCPFLDFPFPIFFSYSLPALPASFQNQREDNDRPSADRESLRAPGPARDLQGEINPGRYLLTAPHDQQPYHYPCLVPSRSSLIQARCARRYGKGRGGRVGKRGKGRKSFFSSFSPSHQPPRSRFALVPNPLAPRSRFALVPGEGRRRDCGGGSHYPSYFFRLFRLLT